MTTPADLSSNKLLCLSCGSYVWVKYFLRLCHGLLFIIIIIIFLRFQMNITVSVGPASALWRLNRQLCNLHAWIFSKIFAQHLHYKDKIQNWWNYVIDEWIRAWLCTHESDLKLYCSSLTALLDETTVSRSSRSKIGDHSGRVLQCKTPYTSHICITQSVIRAFHEQNKYCCRSTDNDGLNSLAN